jgi:hypothetical protein
MSRTVAPVGSCFKLAAIDAAVKQVCIAAITGKILAPTLILFLSDVIVFNVQSITWQPVTQSYQVEGGA